MRILYLSTSLPDEVFQEVNELKNRKLNPAGQKAWCRCVMNEHREVVVKPEDDAA